MPKDAGGKYCTVPCEMCNGEHLRSRDAKSCWSCRYKKFENAIKHCTVCGVKLTDKNWLETNRERGHNICRECFNKQTNEKYKRRRRYYWEKNLQLKKEVMDHYGGKCQCCGVTDLVFLTIDHIDNNGAAHRKEIAKGKSTRRGQGGGIETYRWLKAHNYPDGFQVLCFNCNWAKSHGGCPHKGIITEVMNEESPKEYTCRQCGREFSYHWTLANHIRYSHSQVGETYSKKKAKKKA